MYFTNDELMKKNASINEANAVHEICKKWADNIEDCIEDRIEPILYRASEFLWVEFGTHKFLITSDGRFLHFVLQDEYISAHPSTDLVQILKDNQWLID